MGEAPTHCMGCKHGCATGPQPMLKQILMHRAASRPPKPQAGLSSRGTPCGGPIGWAGECGCSLEVWVLLQVVSLIPALWAASLHRREAPNELGRAPTDGRASPAPQLQGSGSAGQCRSRDAVAAPPCWPVGVKSGRTNLGHILRNSCSSSTHSRSRGVRACLHVCEARQAEGLGIIPIHVADHVRRASRLRHRAEVPSAMCAVSSQR